MRRLEKERDRFREREKKKTHIERKREGGEISSPLIEENRSPRNKYGERAKWESGWLVRAGMSVRITGKREAGTDVEFSQNLENIIKFSLELTIWEGHTAN